MSETHFPANEDWTALREWSGTLADLVGTQTVLGWDRETVMPPGGAEGRAKLLGTMAALSHRELMRPDGDDLLDRAAESASTPTQERFVAVMRRERDRASRTPEHLVRALSEASSRCVTTWIAARPTSDFASFSGPLADVVALTREKAEALEIGDEPYDALLDRFEPGARIAEIEVLFGRVAKGVSALVAQIADDRPPLPERVWPEDAQMVLADRLADLVHYDRPTGALARSAHPFTCSPHEGDVRFTTRLDSGEPIGNILAVMHEAGHALYEQGFPAVFARTPLRDAPSLGAHESQSRFWENHVGRTQAFWNHIEPDLRELFPEAMEGLTGGDLHTAATRVRASYIRVEADEVTYNLHIVLRTELELALIRGDLAVADLPGAWSDRMHELLGIRPDNDSNGCMQDIHWPEGMFGYFPTYTLGNLYAAQLDQSLRAVVGPLEPMIESGDTKPFLDFMRTHVHQHANLIDTQPMMTMATGSALDERPFLAHLERSYLA